jgi:predicted nuclease of predicted toxin-antitoxin system
LINVRAPFGGMVTAKGHDVIESQERSPDPGDREILEWATREGRILVTMDKDFGEFIFGEGVRHAGLIRLPDVPAEKRITMVEGLLREHSKEMSEKAIITVRGGRIRISRLPE